MTVEEFREIIFKIRSFTNYIYLHVLGEPLLHPQLDELLGIAQEAGLFVNITTNGSLIHQKKDILKKHSIRLLNISLHDIEENVNEQEIEQYFLEISDLARQISSKTYICFRLWNQTDDNISAFNQMCLQQLKEKLQLETDISPLATKGNGLKLLPNIYLQNEKRFEWQNKHKPTLNKSCYALKDHIAILSDGSVVPCCLDADAHLYLGNIFTEDLQDILNSEKAIRIKDGFRKKIAVEDFCKTCGFSSKF